MSEAYRVTTLDNLGEYQETIFGHALTAATIGGTIGAIVPGSDTFGVSATWLSMIIQIANHADSETDKAIIQKFLITVVQGAGSYIIGTKVLQGLMMMTGIGIVGSAVLNASLNFLYTARLGIFVAELYDQPGFTSEHMMSTASSAIEIIFKVPTVEELRFAFNMTRKQ
ncbi:MAG: hypothetical protein HC800_23830 [Phormidesmis sp. RL_2_1]|nr:hypothetical protein [Phormidesmis sp. RL_2_1]